jgi:hypothetical protein
MIKECSRAVWSSLKKMSAGISSKIDARDTVIGAGLLMVGVGCWFIHPPVALIVVGVGLFGLGTGMIKIKGEKEK